MEKNSLNIALNYNKFEQLFNEYYSELCRFAISFVKDNDSAEDIVQQVFINLWNKRNEIDNDKPIKAYLLSSIKNRCINYLRDNKKYRSYYLDVEAELEIPVNEKDLISEEYFNEKVQTAIDKLPEKCREIFMLCRFEEMKYKEIAKKLNISQKTVEAQMSKALKIMREELKEFFVLFLLIWFGNMN